MKKIFFQNAVTLSRYLPTAKPEKIILSLNLPFKKQIRKVFTCMILFNLLHTSAVMCQQPKYARPANSTPEQLEKGIYNYTYRLFTAPNKSFGYDVLQNNRVIFHQPAFPKSPIDNEEMLIKKEQAEIAATLTIAKLKKGMRPELTREELIKIGAR